MSISKKRKENWMDKYELLEKYYSENGHIDVPHYYEEDGIKLGFWLNNQRKAYKGQERRIITDEQIELLNSLGMKWELREENWDEYYNLLKEYYQQCGNINVADRYVINEIRLGRWLSAQRKAYKGIGSYKITKNQIQLLNELNMDWSIKDTGFLNAEITVYNVQEYNRILLDRLDHILEDLVYEGINDINSSESMEKMEKVVVKRLWR